MDNEIKRISKGLRRRAIRHLKEMEDLLRIGACPTHGFIYKNRGYKCGTQNGRLVVWHAEISPASSR